MDILALEASGVIGQGAESIDGGEYIRYDIIAPSLEKGQTTLLMKWKWISLTITRK